MKLVISPAKSLDFTRSLPTESNSKACFLREAESLNNILRDKSPQELSELMSISSSLGELNYQRNNSWKLPFNSSYKLLNSLCVFINTKVKTCL